MNKQVYITKLFHVWTFIVYIFFAYLLIAHNDVIWGITKLTSIEEWQSLVETNDDERKTVVNICFLFNSLAYIINTIFFLTLNQYKTISLNLINQICIVTLGAIICILIKVYVDYYLKWEYVYMLVLPNVVIVTVIALLYFLSKSKLK